MPSWYGRWWLREAGQETTLDPTLPPDLETNTLVLDLTNQVVAGRDEGYNARLEATVRPAFTEAYTLYYTADDGIRIWVDGVLVVDQFTILVFLAPGSASAPITLTAGQDHSIVVEHCQWRGNGRDANPQRLTLEWASASQARELIPAAVTAPPDPLGAPVRVRLSEDAAGQFVDAQIDLAFLPTEPVVLGARRAIGHELGGPDLYSFQVVTETLQGGLRSMTGETLMGRLARTRVEKHVMKAGPFLPEAALAVLLGPNGLTTGGIAFARPLPEFRLRGIADPVKLEALTVYWDDDADAPFVREVLDEFFRPFSGYVFRANALDELEVVAPWWASSPPAGPAVILGLSDLTGEGAIASDAASVINRATVTSNGWTFVPAQAVAPNSYWEADPYNTGLFDPPAADDPLPDQWQDVRSTLFIPLDKGILIGNDLTVDVTLNWALRQVNPFNPLFQTLTRGEEAPVTISVPADGTYAVHYYVIRHDLLTGVFYSDEFNFSYDEQKRGIRVGSALRNFGNSYRQAYRVFVSTRASRWQRGNTTVSATFGETGLAERLSAVPGLGDSVTTFGVREQRYDTGVYQLTQATCAAMARAIVETNLNPDIVHTLPIAPPWRVRPEHVGRRVQLPDGSRGVLEGWSYDEAHAPTGSTSALTATVRVEDRVTASSGAEDDNVYATAVYATSATLPLPAASGSAGAGPQSTTGPEPSASWYVDAAAAAGGNGSSERPFTTIAAGIAAASAGQTIIVRAGTYRETVDVNKASLTLVLRPGAIVKASDVQGGWLADGAYWSVAYAHGFTEGDGTSGVLGTVSRWPIYGQSAGDKRCRYADQAFMDGILQYRRTGSSLPALAAGQFWVGNGKLYLGTDPAGKLVEVTTRDRLLRGSGGATGVTVQGGQWLHGANRAQMGAITDSGLDGWSLLDLDVAYSHGLGIKMDGDGSLVERCRTHHHGQMGIGGNGGLATVRLTRTDNNNTQQFNSTWEAGGSKWAGAGCTSLLVEDSEADHNDGPGFWADIDVPSATFRRDRAHHNAKYGFDIEVSFGGLIDTCDAWENGRGYPDWGFGAGFVIQNSSNVTIRDCVAAWNADGISIIRQVRNDFSGAYTDNVFGTRVQDNVIAGCGGYQSWNNTLLGWLQDVQAGASLFDPAQDNKAAGNNRLFRRGGPPSVAYPGAMPDWGAWANKGYSTLADFSATPGGTRCSQLTEEDLNAILTARGIPLAPE